MINKYKKRLNFVFFFCNLEMLSVWTLSTILSRTEVRRPSHKVSQAVIAVSVRASGVLSDDHTSSTTLSRGGEGLILGWPKRSFRRLLILSITITFPTLSPIHHQTPWQYAQAFPPVCLLSLGTKAGPFRVFPPNQNSLSPPRPSLLKPILPSPKVLLLLPPISMFLSRFFWNLFLV